MKDTGKKPQSVLFRTTLSLAIGTILVFAVLVLVFYRQTTVSLISENEKKIETQASSLALAYDSLVTDPSVSDTAIQAFINSFARTEECSVWFVRNDGRIEYSTSVPDFVRGDILKADNYVFLTNDRALDLFMNKGHAITSDVTNGIFANSRSVSVSVAVATSQEDLNIVLFNTLNVENEVFWRLSNALLLPILISFSMALLFFSLMARSLIRPLRALSDAATSVTKGDLSVRIDVPELRKESTLKYMLTDEITNMVSTVNSMIERLERQEADRKVFISSIAHDLRTPLTSIKGFLSAISDGTIPPESYPKYMDIIQTQVARIQELINSMTEASSLSQVDPAKMEEFDINEMIRDTVQNVENLLSDKSISVNVDLGKNKGEQMMVFGESQLLYRVFYNLLTNAIKFTPRDGIIGISTKFDEDEKKVYVSVEDSGSGIPEDKRDRVFESFYKVDPSRTESGFGLGLYICREIIAAHAILLRLHELYPETQCTLDIDDNVFHLVVRAVLSAQCTDVRVNEVTKVLFAEYPDYTDFLSAGEEEIGRIIKPCGFWKAKSHYLYEIARMMRDDFGGEIPKTQEELMRFPGVGRKVANLIVSEMFGIPAVVVDTHCMRVSGRLGLSSGKDPAVIEKELMKILPEEEWAAFGHRMVDHGRAVCTARSPKCGDCALSEYCPSSGKKV